MKEYLIVLEKGDNCQRVCSPDVSGCIATGATREEAERLFSDVLEFHIERMGMEGLERNLRSSDNRSKARRFRSTLMAAPKRQKDWFF